LSYKDNQLFGKQCEILGRAQAVEIQKLLEECKGTESPIENLLLYSVHLWNLVGREPKFSIFPAGRTNGDLLGAVMEIGSTLPLTSTTVFIAPQVKFLNRRRCDFLLLGYMERGGHKSIIEVCVECDGFDWHDKEKSAFEKDRASDRCFQRDDVRVLRFAGTEIWRDAFGCVAEIVDFMGAIRGYRARMVDEAYDSGYFEAQSHASGKGKRKRLRLALAYDRAYRKAVKHETPEDTARRKAFIDSEECPF